MQSSSRIHFRTTPFSLTYICELLLYAGDTCLILQHKDITEIESSVHFGKDKTKSILFGSKHKIKKSKPLKILYNDIKIKQYSKVTYLGCIFDETLSGESMAIHVINKINSRLRSPKQIPQFSFT